MSEDLFDLEQPPSHDLTRIQRLTERAVMLQKAIDVREQELKNFSAELLELRRNLIPDAMAET